jgi:hypothetical protein
MIDLIGAPMDYVITQFYVGYLVIPHRGFVALSVVLLMGMTALINDNGQNRAKYRRWDRLRKKFTRAW